MIDDYNLKLRAGLTWSGKNFFGEDEWIGTDAQWREYKHLDTLQDKGELGESVPF